MRKKYEFLQNKVLVFFLLFFVLYFLVGMKITYRNTFDINDKYFGSDTMRAFLDITCCDCDHYRIKVHPLFLILVQPIEVILNCTIKSNNLSVILLESVAGSLSVVFVYLILANLNINKRISFLLTNVYGFSFSMLLFSSIPETFIFSCFSLTLYWLFVIEAIKSDIKLFSIKSLFLLTFFGLTSFGITLTNYISYIIGLILLISTKIKSMKKRIYTFFMINLIVFLFVFILVFIQKSIWNKSPLFFESIITALKGEAYEETYYMNYKIGLEKTISWFRNVFEYPFIVPNILLERINGNDVFVFGQYNLFNRVLITMFCIFMSFSVINSLIKTYRIEPYSCYLLSLLASLAVNVILHYIYGYYEAFIYSPHFLFMIVVIVSYGLNDVVQRKNSKFVYYFLIFFVIFEIYNNYIGIYKLNSEKVNYIFVLLITIVLFIIEIQYNRSDRNNKEMNIKIMNNSAGHVFNVCIIYTIFLVLGCILIII